MADPIRSSTAIFAVGIVVWTTIAIADTRAGFNETAPPGNDPAAKPLDRSCYVRDDGGAVRYYLEGPLRDGELPYLQGQPITGPDGKTALRSEFPQSDIPPRILRALPCPPGKHHLL